MHKILVPLLILLIVSIAIPVQSATALIVVEDFIMKFVVSFTKSGVTKTQIENFLNNQLFPPMRDKLITKLDANFIEYTISKKLTVTSHGNDRWEVYPKIFFSGSTNLSQVALQNGLDSTIDDWLTVFETEMAVQEASNVRYHIHKSFGSIDVNGAL